MAPLDKITQSIAEHRLNEWYYERWQRDNKVEAPKVITYLDGGARPTDAEVLTHYGKGLLLAEDARRELTDVPEPVPSFDIPAFRVTLQAGPGAGTNGRVGWWRQYGTDNNTWAHENDGGRTPHLATPATGQKRTLSGPRSWVWWLLGSVTIPTDFPSVGRSFATINPHNSAIDVGPSGIGGIGWGFGSGVSNVHIFYASDGYSNGTPNSFYGNVNPSPTRRYELVPSVIKGKRYDFACEIILGRSDKQLGLAGPGVSGGGIGDHPNGGEGRVRWFVDGQLVVDTGNRDTLLRAAAPDGKTYTQTLMHRPWDGAYCVSGLSRDITMDRTLTRVGRTLAEALADEPPYSLRAEWGEGGGSFANLPPLDSASFRAP